MVVGFIGEMMMITMKSLASKALVIKINLAFLTFFIIAAFAILRPPSVYDDKGATIVPCSLPADCHMHQEGKTINVGINTQNATEKIPGFFAGLQPGARIGLVNIDDEEAAGWGPAWRMERMEFEPVSAAMEWKDLFPEWIDEEEENEGGPSCPEIPMPDFSRYGELDAVAVRAPCRRPEDGGSSRDVRRLQAHLVAAGAAARRGRRDGRGKVRVAVATGGGCRPMVEIFRCEELVGRAGEWWVYEADGGRLEEKVGMPVGSCQLALPLWREGTDKEYDDSKPTVPAIQGQREAYATVLHSSDMYVCGAIALAQSILRAGTTRDLVLLHDRSIPSPKLRALADAGWILCEIKRISNPHAEKGSYNEYNYSKLRLWQLTYYRKVVFIDADIAVLRSLDILFHLPQMSAVGNDGVLFNSGIMVIEPSNCTFKHLMARRRDIISYNGGDQGFLNEVFVWWHRLPRRVNFLKNFWANTTAETAIKNSLFGADPPRLYSIHYLGLKPWLCYRDYDCNWNLADQWVYASDVAHRRWWRVHDEMDGGLQRFCGLSSERKNDLEWDRSEAKRMGLRDGHWKLRIKDRRKKL